MIVVADLVDQVGRPKDAYSLVGDKTSYDFEDPGPRFDVEPGRRFIEQQHARPVQERPRDLDPPHLTAGKEPHLVAGSVSETHAAKLDRPSLARLTRADAVQCAVIGKILRDAEVGIERALLKHHAEPRESRAALTGDVAPENAHHARSADVKMCDHREQRALAGAIQAQKYSEAGGGDVEAHLVQRDSRAIGVRHVLDRERADGRLRHCVGDDSHCFEIATPQGNEPTGIDLITFSAATSMTEISFETPLVVTRYLPSGVSSNCQTR